MAKITLKEYGERHGIRHNSLLARVYRGNYATAEKIGCQWFIDEDDEFVDGRISCGIYRDWRDKYPSRAEKPPEDQ